MIGHAQLAAALFSLEDVDLNALLDDEVHTLLDAKDELHETAGGDTAGGVENVTQSYKHKEFNHLNIPSN